MLGSDEYQHLSSWAEATLDGIDALLLPGGHRARAMRSYIDSETLHRLVVDALAPGIRCRRQQLRISALAGQHQHFR